MFKKFRKKSVNKDELEHATSSQDVVFSPIRATNTFSGSTIVGSDRRRSSTSPSEPFNTHERRKSSSASRNRTFKTHASSNARSNATSNSLGLWLVHHPPSAAPLDIVFIHGLGGDRQKTWSQNHDPQFFWPGLWLPYEADIGSARIFSFGYKAEVRPGTGRSIANIGDFAKELLFEMKFGKTDDGQDYAIGKVPIIFVVHSMGGLVAKKAILLGQNDEEYQQIIRSISGVIFLATPHRGSGLADVLARILSASMQAPRAFLNDLSRSSVALEELNESFRHIAPRLSVWSFYETLATKIGVQRLMVLDKDSAILGYPREVSRPLNADHHGVCKYSSPDDTNYISVKNALKSLVARFRSKGLHALSEQTLQITKAMEQLLAIGSSPEDDYKFFLRRWTPGTCEWFFGQPEVDSWLSDPFESRILWYSGSPGGGKSVLASFIIKHLHGMGVGAQFFFFRFDNQPKRSISTCLKSLAWQIANDHPEFNRRLNDLSEAGLNLEKTDAVSLWQMVFESILFQIELANPLYWVIDGLDESETPQLLLEIFRAIPRSLTPIRLLITSRKTDTISMQVGGLSEHLPVAKLENSGRRLNSNDIQILIQSDIKQMRGGNAFKNQVMAQLMDHADGNFLWVRLVMDEILCCHTEEAVQETLDNMPEDMTSLYQRMEASIVTRPRKSDKLLAKSLLQWVLCARRSLTLDELSGALPKSLDLKRTIEDICGQFIVIYETGRVMMIHQTARDYLTRTSTSEIAIDPEQANKYLCIQTISALLEPTLQSKLMQKQRSIVKSDPFIVYAATSWTYHLKHSSATYDEVFDFAVKLLRGISVLNWIYILALVNKVDTLVKASKDLSALVTSRRKLDAKKNPMLHRLDDLDFLDQWSTELIKIVGKFIGHLRLEPQAIYKLIPPVCPKQSILHQQFYKEHSAEVIVSGTPSSWDDNLARTILPNGDRGFKITSAGPYIAVLGFTGTTYIWNSHNFSEVGSTSHGEPITAFCLNRKGDTLATYGLSTTKCWSIPSGKLLCTVANVPDVKAMTLEFSERDSNLITGGDDRIIRHLKLNDMKPAWTILSDAPSREHTDIQGSITNSPMWMAINGDHTQVGISYRGSPMAVWSTTEPHCIGLCMRSQEYRIADDTTTWYAVSRFTWNPVSGHVIGIHRHGSLFKWHPLTHQYSEAHARADEIAASPDGKLFVTSDSDGSITVWNFAFFSRIYRLSSTDLVYGLAFGSNSRRFHDLRGRNLNTWEPDSLIRFSESEDSFSDSTSEGYHSSSVTYFSEAGLTDFDTITAISASLGTFYCIGSEEGVVTLHDTESGRSWEVTKFYNYHNISELIWSRDSSIVVAADLSGEIVITRVTMEKSKQTVTLEPLQSPNSHIEGDNLYQMLMSSDAKLLLLIRHDLSQLWSLEENKTISTMSLAEAGKRRWSQHPSNKHLFVGFGTTDAVIYGWKDMKKISQPKYRHSPDDYDASNESRSDGDNLVQHSSQVNLSTVTRALLTKDSKFILLRIEETSVLGSLHQRTLIFESSSFDDIGDTEPCGLTHLHIPNKILSNIYLPLGVQYGSRFMFMDENLWHLDKKSIRTM
ncbi:putative wd40 repeat-containing protein [Phaeomoniella chlamydospora]|uniref:Putative wd40 repeat-containing protein n=1 Tax=Phaeomoniella chlamydospora TaxID=158046 RepID=A0A0G2E740_PHACM|nr:putative wd40 repeat-containing protein [Phaeomoniella chlamydospora]